jgi:L-malate glycosyltransferase
MRILLVCDALLTGGAETFALRLGSALKQRGHLPTLVILRRDLVDDEQYYRLASNVDLAKLSLPISRTLRFLDGCLYRIGMTFSLLRYSQIQRLKALIRLTRPDVVHAHLITSDLVVSRACAKCCVPWISTMHGDYLALEESGSSKAARIPDFKRACLELEPSVSCVVCITDQQVRQLERLMPSLSHEERTLKIYNGYALTAPDLNPTGIPAALNRIPPNAFVVGMVARGVKKKGWDVLVHAFEALDLPDAWLVLVGDGDHLQSLRCANQNPRIVFCGNVVDPLRYIARFDVACLPTQFTTESLPTVVVEYMLMGKPVVATAVGEIPAMLEAFSPDPAGLLVNVGGDDEMVPRVQEALKRLYADPSLRRLLGANALRAVRKFDMDACVDAYLEVYAEAKDRRATFSAVRQSPQLLVMSET